MKISFCYAFFSMTLASMILGCSETPTSETPVTDTVIISGMKFNPQELTVNKNDTVVWINQGMVSHNVASFPDMKWKSDTIAVGSSWRKAINEDLDYFCTIHPTMKGKIVVKK